MAKMKVTSFLLFCAIFTSAQKYEGVKLSILYESLSPDSADFITKQLFPNYEHFKDKIDLNFVPFGLSSQSLNKNQWNFQCTRGPSECLGNILHSCAYNLMKTSQDDRMTFANCMMSSENPADVNVLAKKCAEVCQIDYDELKNCATNSNGDELLALNGMKTLSVSPKIISVPTVIFNGNNVPVLAKKCLKDFQLTMCQILSDPPSVCYNKS